jgi:signal peptidase I
MDKRHAHYCQVAATLTRSLLNANQPVQMMVVSQSMAPLIVRGDRVWVAPVEATTLNRGDLVVFQRGYDCITHRFLGRHGRLCYTKGDQSIVADHPVEQEQILGRVVAMERNGCRVELHQARWRVLNRVMGWAGWLEWQVSSLLQARQKPPSYAWHARRAGPGRWLRRPLRVARQHLLARSTVWGRQQHDVVG